MRVVSFEIISNNTLRILKHDVQYSSFNCIMLVNCILTGRLTLDYARNCVNVVQGSTDLFEGCESEWCNAV